MQNYSFKRYFNFLIVFLLITSSSYSYSQVEVNWNNSGNKRIDYVKLLAASVKQCMKRSDTEHPVFRGCIDWHSSVHGHWALLRAYRVTQDKELLDIVKKSLNQEAMVREYNFLKSNPAFEMPYGRSWFLKLMIEYEMITGETTYRFISDYVAQSLMSFLSTRNYDPSKGEYDNESWAYRNLLEYYRHTKDVQQVAAIKAKIKITNLPEVKFADDFLDPGFFSKWGNLAHLLSLTMGKEEFKRWIKLNDLTEKDLQPVESYRSVHHLGINYSRAWALWSIYSVTKQDAFFKAYLAHIEKGILLHEKYKDDYHSYGHWIPQFAIYAITSSLYEK
jgi:hypothetical protein